MNTGNHSTPATWKEAERIQEDWNFFDRKTSIAPNQGTLPARQHGVTQAEAFSRFLAHLETSGARNSVRKQCRIVGDKAREFFSQKKLEKVTEWSFPLASEFRSSWRSKGTPLAVFTTRGYQTALRKFFSFCVPEGWISENPAEKLGRPMGKEVKSNPPFTRGEVAALLEEATKPWQFVIYGRKYNQDHLFAQLVIMRHCGLRISDTVALEAASVDFAKQIITFQPIKTRNKIPRPTKLTIPAKPIVLEALARLTPVNGYYFQAGRGRSRR